MRTSFIWTVIHNGDFLGGSKMDEIGTKKSRLRIFEFSKMNPNSQKIKYFLIFEVLNFEGIRVQYIVIYGIFKVNFLQLF